jgi:hypothetical protein
MYILRRIEPHDITKPRYFTLQLARIFCAHKLMVKDPVALQVGKDVEAAISAAGARRPRSSENYSDSSTKLSSLIYLLH